MKVLFLYSELAGYFLAGVKTFVERYNAEAHIVRWPLNAEAPFKFGKMKGVTWYERADLDDKQLVQLCTDLNPDVVYVVGWMDKGYVKVARTLCKMTTPVICALDNQWTGSFRQRIASFLSKSYLKARFNHMWVPGLYQYEFARRLGFEPHQVHTGMYPADTEKFGSAYTSYLPEKTTKYPHQFLFVARFVEYKGVRELYQGFQELAKEMDHDWKLILVGAGPLRDQFPATDRIEIRDFVQPEVLPELAKESGAFVLPSHVEPWGVALHEFAAAGLPIVASEACGAATAFLRNGYNGFRHKPKDKNDLKRALRKIIETPDEDLLKMGNASHELAQQITTETWASTLYSIGKSEI